MKITANEDETQGSSPALSPQDNAAHDGTDLHNQVKSYTSEYVHVLYSTCTYFMYCLNGVVITVHTYLHVCCTWN